MGRRSHKLQKILIQTGLRGINKGQSFEIDFRNIGNETFLASLQADTNSTSNIYRRNEDAVGALYYVCVVIVIYAFGIIMMIGSVINKGKHDKSIYKYMSDMDKVRRLEKRQEKFETRLLIQKKKIPFQALQFKSMESAEDEKIFGNDNIKFISEKAEQRVKIHKLSDQFAKFTEKAKNKDIMEQSSSCSNIIISEDENCSESVLN